MQMMPNTSWPHRVASDARAATVVSCAAVIATDTSHADVYAFAPVRRAAPEPDRNGETGWYAIRI
jgi:hypothetical protein